MSELVILNINDKSGTHNLSNSNLTDSINPSGVGNDQIRSNLGKSKGKWYWEIQDNSYDNAFFFGISSIDYPIKTPFYNADKNARIFFTIGKTLYPSSISYGNAIANGDTISILLDLENGTLEFWRNGITLGIAFSNLNSMTSPIYPIFGTGASGASSAQTFTVNFGSTPFKYDIPTGFESYEKISSEKILIRSNAEYFYHDTKKWMSLGLNPTTEEILQYGMNDITTLQIQQFESSYGTSWYPVRWTDGEGALEATFNAIPIPQILKAKNSIQLTGVVGAEFKWTATGGSRVALSVNEGLTYHALKNGAWLDVTNDMANAMTAEEYSNMTWEQYKSLAGESNFLKHQYYIPDNSTVDDILITAELMGSNKLANTSDYTTTYDQSAKKITIAINKSGTYFANYVDVSE